MQCKWNNANSIAVYAGLLLFSLVACTGHKPIDLVQVEEINTGQISHAYALSALDAHITHNKARLADNAEDREALAELSQLHTLKGAAGREGRSEQRRQFKLAMHYAEQIMLLNPAFSTRVHRGEKAWQASDSLGKQESDGLGWWATAMLYYYREGLPSFAQYFNYKLVVRAKLMMGQLERVNPDWENGTNYFNLAIYYHALPEFAGGNPETSQAYMQKAEKAGPTRFLIPWGKAKYIHSSNRDTDAYIAALNWVVEQDVKIDNGEHALWRVYFQQQAREMLAGLD